LAIRSSALSRVPGRRVGGAVIDEVQLRIPREPAPNRAAADLPLVAVPGLDRAVLADRLAERHRLLGVEQDLILRSAVVSAPWALAGVGVVGRDVALDVDLGAGSANEDLAADGERRSRAGFTLLGIAVRGLPELLAGLRVKGNEVRVGLIQEDL